MQDWDGAAFDRWLTTEPDWDEPDWDEAEIIPECTCTPEAIDLPAAAVEEFGSAIAYRHSETCALTVAYATGVPRETAHD